MIFNDNFPTFPHLYNLGYKRKYCIIQQLICLGFLFFFLCNSAIAQHKKWETNFDDLIIGTNEYFDTLYQVIFNSDWHIKQRDSMTLVYFDQTKTYQKPYYEATILYKMGRLNRQEVNYNRGIQLQRQALEVTKNIEPITEQVLDREISILSELSTNYLLLFEFTKAIEYAEQALSLSQKHNILDHIFYTNCELGDVYFQISQTKEEKTKDREESIQKSIHYYERALDVATESNRSDWTNYASGEICQPYMSQGRFQEVVTIGLKLMSICSKNKEYRFQVLTALDIAMAYTELQQFDYAKNYLDTALVLVNQHNFINYKSSVYDYLYYLHKSKGDYKTALHYYQLYETLKDSLWNEKKQLAFNELELSFETQQKEQANQLLQQEKKSLQTWVILIGFFAFFVLKSLAVLYWFFIKSRRQKSIIQQQHQELAALDELKSHFFANISHELRTPLSLVIGPLTDILNKEKLNEQVSSTLKKIQNNVQQLIGLIEEVMDLSKLEANKMTLSEEKVALYSFVKRIVASFSSYAQYRKIDLQFDYQASSHLLCWIDNKKMEKIINNLLSNALKFTPSNGKVSLVVEDLKNQISIQVTDTGIGIHPDDLPYIFKRYYQGKKQQTTPTVAHTGGTGIGLALSAEYAKLMGGNIEVKINKSKQQGTTFIFNFPKKEIFSEPPFLEPESKLKEKTVTVHDSTKKTSTILLVEDHPEMLNYLQSILSPSYQLVHADTGKTALQQLSKQPVDLIISDVMMPEMDGFELLQAVKEQPRWQDKPFILLTARVETDDKLKGLRMGVDDYITKPFLSEELIARVRNLLNHYHLRTAQQVGLATSNRVPNFETVEAYDNVWLEELENIVKQHIGDANFNVTTLAQLLLMSERSLRTKIKAHTGLSPLYYIREIRLLKARYLFENKVHPTVARTCYAVGLKPSSHFSKLYQKRFGKLPSAYFQNS